MALFCILRPGIEPDAMLHLCGINNPIHQPIVAIPMGFSASKVQDFRNAFDMLNMQSVDIVWRQDLNDMQQTAGLATLLSTAFNSCSDKTCVIIDMINPPQANDINRLLSVLKDNKTHFGLIEPMQDQGWMAVAAKSSWLKESLSKLSPHIGICGLAWALKTISQQQGQTIAVAPIQYRPCDGPSPLERQQQLNIVFEWAKKMGLEAHLPTTVNNEAHSELTTIVMPIYNNLKLTQDCVKSIIEHTHLPYEIILIDNGSTEPIGEWAAPLCRDNPNITYHRNAQNQGFPQACNTGMAMAKGTTVILLNNDTVVTPFWISKLIAPLQVYSRIGVTGPRSINIIPPNRLNIQPFKSIEERDQFATELALKNAAKISLKQLLAGLCLCIKKTVIDEVGGLDPIFGIGNMEEDDYAVRVQRRGYLLALVEDLFVDHVGGAAFDSLNLNYKLLLVENHLNWQQKHKTPDEFKAHFLHLKKGAMPKQNRYHLAVATEQKWDVLRDKIPLTIVELLKQRGRSMAWPSQDKKRWIAFPKWLNPKWMKPLARLFQQESDVSLILRFEPCHPLVLEHVSQQLTRFCKQTLNSSIPTWVHLDATPVESTDRRKLYESVDALLALPRSDSFKYEREALALEIEVIDPKHL